MDDLSSHLSSPVIVRRCAAAFALLTVLCVEGATLRISSAAVVENSDCLEAAADAVNCTANDTGLANTRAGKVYDPHEDADCTSATCLDDDPTTACTDVDCDQGCTSTSDTITFDLYGDLQSTATTRYDLGIYIAESGGSALDGDSCTVSVIDAPLAGADDGDACAEITSTLIEDVLVGRVRVSCAGLGEAVDGVADLAIDTCSAWDQNADADDCLLPTDALPGTPSKCSCGPILVPVPVRIDPCEGVVCSDGASCNGLETCDPETGECLDGTPEPCAGDGSACTIETCEPNAEDADETTGCLISAGNAGTECRAADGVCDVAETCSGDSASCPADGVAAVDVTCRAADGVCDVAETCDGSGKECPANGFASGTTCRESDGVCDVAETCDGSGAECPADGFVGAGTECRGSAGVCDMAEACSGDSASCPADGFADASIVCRSAAGECDVAENCDGSAAECPADGKSTDVCRAAVDDCDVAETCDGGGNDCPSDAFADAGAACTDGDVFACTVDVCDGSGGCVGEPDDGACADEDLCTDERCDPQNADANGEGCVYGFDATNDDESDDPDRCDLETCRTAGFWSTHGGVTRAVLEQAPAGCTEICGEILLAEAVASASDADSALEAMCVPVKGDTRLQLVRQLTAASLNCLISRGSADCENASIEATYQACDAVCAAGGTTATVGEETIDCLAAIDCFNNGGDYRPGSSPSCVIGTCDGVPETNGGVPCDASTSCGEHGSCVPRPGNCHDQAEPNAELGVSVTLAGPADTSRTCTEASRSKCSTIPPGETAAGGKGCTAGERGAEESCPAPSE